MRAAVQVLDVRGGVAQPGKEGRFTSMVRKGD